MSFVEALILNIILLLFPIFIYLLYVAYSNNINKEKGEYIFDILCITSIYFLIKYKIYFFNVSLLLLINVPLILLFLKKRYKCCLILSIIIVIYYSEIYNLSLIFNIIEYIFYFVFFRVFGSRNKNNDFFIYSFIFFKGIIVSFQIFYIIEQDATFLMLVFQTLLILLVFYIVLTLSLMLLEKGEQILSLNKVLKELEKEKVLRNALFKLTHEIKNPIAVCKGYLDMIDYNDLNKAKKYNEVIKSEIARTLIIMDEFLDYTKIKVNLDNMDIIMLLEDTLLSIKPLLVDKNIKLIKNIPDDEIYINGDYNKLKQVFINVLKNSIESITQSKGEISVSLFIKKKNIIIEFYDNGCGMNKEVLSKINDMFFTTKVKGTGLGIPLSNEIIKLHNGKMKFESIDKKSTKVIITLPKEISDNKPLE